MPRLQQLQQSPLLRAEIHDSVAINDASLKLISSLHIF